jgi:3-(3-hydroxy-phenyl)propionate hydroxylase
MPDDTRVLIAGGGPVGLFCALLLGRRGIPVRLFDENHEPQQDPRAATTHPATLELLGAAGLVEDMARVGLVAPIFQFWDRPTGRKVAEFDHALLKDDTRYPFVIQCEQFKTARLIEERLAELPNVEVLFDHAVVEVEQGADDVTIAVKGPEGTTTHSGAYLIGADGGRSTVRKQSGIEFAGFTWPERFIVLTTPFDFGASRGYCPRNYFADPDEWCNCFKVSADGPPGLWRTVFPTDQSLSEAELMSDEAVQARLQKFFPSDMPYEIVHRNLYTTHQRVAAGFRTGRVLLAGDAAHVNNPIGGMGMNGGMHDGINLADKLARVIHGEADEALLDLYSRQRRHVAVKYVQTQTIANKKLMEERDPAARAAKFDELRRISDDPAASKAYMRRAALLDSLNDASAVT